jgi:hypothetical protein
MGVAVEERLLNMIHLDERNDNDRQKHRKASISSKKEKRTTSQQRLQQHFEKLRATKRVALIGKSPSKEAANRSDLASQTETEPTVDLASRDPSRG